MNMGLLAADLSLGSPSVKVESGTSTSVVVRQHIDKHHSLVKPVISAPACDLRALELYHKALEDERLKIQAFEKELPFCMQLLENAIEASKEQLEERLACKLNTPLHEPPLAAATHEFVCNYTSSFTAHRRLVPALGEINLRFKRKWTSAPSSSMFDHSHHLQSHDMTSGCATKWFLPQNTKLAKNEDMPVTCIKGSIKVQEFSIPEHALPATDESQKLVSEIGRHATNVTFNCINAAPSHGLHLHNAKQTLSLPAHPYIQEDKYVLSKTKSVNNPDGQHGAQAIPERSLNDAACSDVNGSGPLICHAKLSPKELQISTAISSPLSKSSSHGNFNVGAQSGAVQRKPRRCWSPELHQRFLSALNHLGGCQVATPKQIRELMNVEGLTNDEVKSHLQKFRLHMRRPNGVVTNPQGNSQQAAAAGRHLVVFGHIWVPPEYGDQHHQHAANANIDIISSEFPTTANGAMELMQGFRSSGSELGTANIDMDIEHGNGHAQLGHVSSVQCRDVISGRDNDVVAQAGLLRLCREEYCSDEEKGLKNMQHHDESDEERITAYNAADVAGEREASICMHRQQQQQIDHIVKQLRVEELAGAEKLLHAEEKKLQEID